MAQPQWPTGPFPGRSAPSSSASAFLYLVAWPLILVAVVLAGWTEDRAAKRPIRLWPRPVRQTEGA
ncbi:hypothetical protein ACWC09_04975 [Streptomyces sp. NPDC001617]